MDIHQIPAYELIFTEELPDVQSVGYLLRHKKSGARVALLENEDDNKVFNIAFRTTPTNSTGVAHIMEHSVLCGSREFPSKDPFVELVKGSMNTFLNAMTYSDKTMYPVASCNDKDFANLMHVYLDAVFYPNIYQKKEIFLQEGWHLEKGEDGELSYNGVVYNEMKGAFSTPDDVLERQIQQSLFPDTTYGWESGGDPERIPSLDYEQFLDFHRTYYHPSNSYIYLYGNMDMAERLNWMDEHYLSHFDRIEVSSQITLQKPFDSMQTSRVSYPITDEEETEHNTFLSWNVVIGTSADTRLSMALDVLEYALLETPGAPLKEALLDAGIGADVMGSYDSGIIQPVFSVMARGADASDEERFLQIIRGTLEKICEEGLDPKALQAAVNSMEFRFREADYGTFPRGLMYGIDMFDTWLYDDEKPFDCLKQLKDYAFLKGQTDTGYYETIIREQILANPHASCVVLSPEKGLSARREQETREQLDALKASWTEEDWKALEEETEKLRLFQETPSTPEELAAIPLLERSDLRPSVLPLSNEEYRWDGVTLVRHDYASFGIAYMNVLMDASGVAEEDLYYLALLRSVLGMVDTERYSYKEVLNEINIHTGGITPGISVFPYAAESNRNKVAFGMAVRTLEEEIGYAFDMMAEILLTSNLEQEKRLYEIVRRMRSRMESRMISAGSQVAAGRCMTYFSGNAVLNDQIGGIAWYRFLQELEANFDSRLEDICRGMRRVLETLVGSGRVLISYTGPEEFLPAIREGAEKLVRRFGGRGAKDAEEAGLAQPQSIIGEYPCPEVAAKNEGFKSSAQVQYVARGGSFARKGYAFHGALRVLKTIMNYDYLWNQIRVLGGAYGCSVSFSRSGDSVFVSYRDPHLKRTNAVFEAIPEYVRHFSADERDMTKYVIGTVSEMDTPLMANAMGSRSMASWLTGVTEELLQRERSQVLEASPEDIRALAPLLDAVLEQQCLCVLGNDQKIAAEEAMFLSTCQL